MTVTTVQRWPSYLCGLSAASASLAALVCGPVLGYHREALATFGVAVAMLIWAVVLVPDRPSPADASTLGVLGAISAAGVAGFITVAAALRPEWTSFTVAMVVTLAVTAIAVWQCRAWAARHCEQRTG